MRIAGRGISGDFDAVGAALAEVFSRLQHWQPVNSEAVAARTAAPNNSRIHFISFCIIMFRFGLVFCTDKSRRVSGSDRVLPAESRNAPARFANAGPGASDRRQASDGAAICLSRSCLPPDRKS